MYNILHNVIYNNISKCGEIRVCVCIYIYIRMQLFVAYNNNGYHLLSNLLGAKDCFKNIMFYFI